MTGGRAHAAHGARARQGSGHYACFVPDYPPSRTFVTPHSSWLCRAQYTGHADAANVEKVLRSDLKAMFERRFNKDEYEQYDEKFIVQARASREGICSGTGTFHSKVLNRA